DGPEGVDVCLTCFNGGCTGKERHHAQTHYQLSGHPLAVNIKRVLIQQQKRTRGTPPPPKISKLGIEEENEDSKYKYVTQVRCYGCTGKVMAVDGTKKLEPLVNAVLSTLSSAKQSEVKAWSEEITPCEHTLCLVQDAPKNLQQQDLAHCANCELNENLWLCLSCGNLGCGRKQYDGSGGNNHAIEHFHATGHGVNCKLGTITPEGTAGKDRLAAHLANWGINVASQTKTEKSMTELQLEQNMKFDFSMTTEDGKQLEPQFGPGYTGLKNLGNSCYMASVLQSVFNLRSFKHRYLDELNDHASVCTNDPAGCWSCQLHKIADGLLSGRYSQPTVNNEGVPSQKGIPPTMFKSLIGKGHEEFSTMRQQDAFEFFQYLCKTTQQKENVSNNDPSKVFDFTTEQRLQCMKCKKAVDFYECMDTFVKEELVDGYECPRCREKTTASRCVKFSTFPEILVINPRRFAFVNWVPQKLNIPIKFPTGPMNLDKYVSQGQQSDEDLLPDDMSASSNEEISFNDEDIQQLQSMGFSENRCKRALLATGHNGSEIAMNWMFEHMDDPDIDDPLPTTQSSTNDSEISLDQIQSLQEMGFSADHAKKALKETVNAKPPFNYIVDSFISHKGTSVHCGHYVSHVFKNGKWTLFNDNKVAITPTPPIEEAYLYFLRRKD
ncbi:hypothetical protein BDB01DRAFT_722821, partial [Pilobolus umbonatus]